jgi:hypothetical protein
MAMALGGRERGEGGALMLKRRKEGSLETPRRPAPTSQGGGGQLHGLMRASSIDRAVGGKEEVVGCLPAVSMK